MSLEKIRQAGQDLYHRLHLPCYPVAIKYIKSESEIPDGVIRPQALGQKWSLCQAQTYARSWGWHVAITEAENFCVPASAMHQWLNVTHEELLESQVHQGWHKSREAEVNRFRSARQLLESAGKGDLGKRAREYCGFVASPLHQTVVEPDTVLVYGSGTHITHLVHAICYDYQSPVTSAFEGFGEACFKGGLLPFLTGRPQIVLPGMGDRSFAGASEHELAIAFPGTMLQQILEDLFKTGGAMNMGMPPKTLMPNNLNENITPGFKFLREVADKKVRK